MEYLPRTIDQPLEDALRVLPAVALDGAKGVGKTVCAERMANSVMRLDRPDDLSILRADRDRIDRLDKPVLLDEVPA